jgi:hypothetical protein
MVSVTEGGVAYAPGAAMVVKRYRQQAYWKNILCVILNEGKFLNLFK